MTQFTGAFNDNFFRSALVMLIMYKMFNTPEHEKYARTLVNMAAGFFMLPYCLFSTLAGEVADKFERVKIGQCLKGIELLMMCCLPLLWLAREGVNVFGLFVLQGEFVFLAFLFLMGTHSTFFSPIKYSLLPLELRKNELVAGNAYLEAGTQLAILSGVLLGTLLVMRQHGEAIVMGTLVFSGILGVCTSLFIPKVRAGNPELKVHWNILRETFRIVGHVRQDRAVFWSIMGISWFWVVGLVFLTQFSPLCKNTLHVTENVMSLFLVLFAMGIGIGSVLCNRLLKGVLSMAYVPVASFGMAVSAIAFYVMTRHWTPVASVQPLANITEFLSVPLAWGMCLSLFFFTLCCGIYNVPLYVLMQSRAPKEFIARVIAGNNIINSFFMFVAAGVCALLLHAGMPLPLIFLVTGILCLGVTAALLRSIPRALSQVLLRAFFKVFFRLRVEGLENFGAVQNQKVIVTPNHVSLLDGFLICALLPGRIGFAIDEDWMRKWFMKIIGRLVYALPVSTTNPLAVRRLMAELNAGRTVIIFPEGRITTTGALSPLQPGAAVLAHKTGAWIVPVRIEGAERSLASYLRGKVKRTLFPKITLTVGEPQKLEAPAELQGAVLRRALVERHRAMMGG